VSSRLSTPVVRALLDALAGFITGHATLHVDFGLGTVRRLRLLTHLRTDPLAQLVNSKGVFAFHFSDAFLARCGVVPPSRSASRAGPRPSAPPAPLQLLAAAFKEADSEGTGLLPRRAAEDVLRGPAGRRVLESVSSYELMCLLDAASEQAGRAVAYERLLGLLGASGAPVEPTPAPPPPPPPPPKPSPARPPPPPLLIPPPPPVSVPEPRGAVTCKVGERTERHGLAARKAQEAEADRERVAYIMAALEAEALAVRRARVAKQLELRASLDEQVAGRIVGRGKQWSLIDR